MNILCAKFIYKYGKLYKVEVLADYSALTVCKPLTDVRAVSCSALSLYNIKYEAYIEYTAKFGYQFYPKNVYSHFGLTVKEVKND